MTRQLEPIIITPEQIMAAAAKIAAKDDRAWEYTSEQYLTAVRDFLAGCISDIVGDADWVANKSNFSADKKHAMSFMHEASDFAVPPAPEWAHDEIVAAVQ